MANSPGVKASTPVKIYGFEAAVGHDETHNRWVCQQYRPCIVPPLVKKLGIRIVLG